MWNGRLTPTQAWLVHLCDPAGPPQGLPAGRLSPADLTALRLLADRHGVLPAVTANLQRLVASGGGAADLPASPAELADLSRQAQGRLAQHAAVALYLRGQLRLVLARMGRLEVPVLVLKGPTFADRLYRWPALRPFVDVDLLLPAGAWERAGQAMQAAGFQPRDTPMKYATGYGEQAWNRPEDPGCVFELHTDLVNSPTLRRGLSVRYEDLVDRPATQDGTVPGTGSGAPGAGSGVPDTDSGAPGADSGVPSPALTPAAMLLTAAVHAAAGHGFDKLQHLCDLAQLARGAAGPVDAGWLRQALDRTGADLALAAGLDLAGRTLGEPVCGELLAEVCPRWPRRRCRWLLSPALVLRARSPQRWRGSWRRQVFRQWLKRRSRIVALPGANA